MVTTPPRNAARRHERLWSIAGRWATDGHVIADPPIPVTGFDTYEVLAGGYFLVHHVNVHVGDQPVRAIEIIGEPDPATDGFLVRSFDNTGSWEVMRLTVDDEGVFHFVGGPDVATAAQADGQTAGVRSTLTLAADGGSMRAFWERSPDGHTWEPWMHISFTKLDERQTTQRRGMLEHSDVATRLPAQDLERARAFYADKLGLEPVEERPGGLRYRCGAGSFVLFASTGAASGNHTQMAWEVDDIEAVVHRLRSRGVVFEDVDVPGLRTIDGIAEVEGNYPSAGGVGERAAWFRDSEGNLLGIGQPVR